MENTSCSEKFQFETTTEKNGPATFTSLDYRCCTCFKKFNTSNELGRHLRESLNNPNIPEILKKEPAEAKKEIEKYKDNL